jgi:hypothetical protein
MASTAMSRAEREAFLAGVHVGVISLADDARGPLTVPIWYGYEPGDDVWIITDRDSRKGKLLVKLERFSLCAQTETAQYKYVSVEDRRARARGPGAPHARAAPPSRRKRGRLHQGDRRRQRATRASSSACGPSAGSMSTTRRHSGLNAPGELR